MRNKKELLLTLCLCLGGSLFAREYHVTPQGSDVATGTVLQPLRTINRAAQLALPGDTVTVHNGVYREWVNPLNGGESDDKRILYRVAPGEKAELKGSEVVTGWKPDKRGKGVWKAVVDNQIQHSLQTAILGCRDGGHQTARCHRRIHSPQPYSPLRKFWRLVGLDGAGSPHFFQLVLS